jgi:hypothetical protein
MLVLSVSLLIRLQCTLYSVSNIFPKSYKISHFLYSFSLYSETVLIN